MKLLTKSIRDKLIRNHTENEGQEETKKHKVVVKLFNPSGAGTWYSYRTKSIYQCGIWFM